MGIQIGAKPDSGFDDPLGMLTDCHRRIERFLHILCLVVDRARGRSLTAEETEAIDASLQYFHAGGQRHNADEEQSLFPRLRAECPGVDLEELGGLESDHQRASQLHSTVESCYQTWIASGQLSQEDQERLLIATGELSRLYNEHIRREEQSVFPRAAKALNAAAIAAMGEEFRARRQ